MFVFCSFCIAASSSAKAHDAWRLSLITQMKRTWRRGNDPSVERCATWRSWDRVNVTPVPPARNKTESKDVKSGEELA